MKTNPEPTCVKESQIRYGQVLLTVHGFRIYYAISWTQITDLQMSKPGLTFYGACRTTDLPTWLSCRIISKNHGEHIRMTDVVKQERKYFQTSNVNPKVSSDKRVFIPSDRVQGSTQTHLTLT